MSKKIPMWNSEDFRHRVGDCIYDYSDGDEPSIRDSVHNESNRATDLGGENVIISDHFYYFGRATIHLPPSLFSIVHDTQGHKSKANELYKDAFIHWIEGLGHQCNVVLAEPQLKEWVQSLDPLTCRTKCAERNRKEDAEDREIC